MPPPLPAAAAAEGHTNLKEHVGEVLLGLDGCGFLLIQQRLQGELGRWKSARKGTVLDTKAAETQGKGSVLPAISSAYSAGVSLRSHSPVQGQSCQFARADHGAGGSNNARPMHGYAEVLMLFPPQHVAVPVKEEQEKKEQQEQEQEQQEQQVQHVAMRPAAALAVGVTPLPINLVTGHCLGDAGRPQLVAPTKVSLSPFVPPSITHTHTRTPIGRLRPPPDRQ